MNSITRYLLICLAFLASGNLSAADPTVTVTYFYTDLAGSVVAKTDAQGNVIWRKSYASYGATTERDEDNRRGFTGHAEDPNGLVYMRNRYYDPESGRFWATDAVGLDPNNPMTFNRYAYANNNPYRYVDPDGRESVPSFAVVPWNAHKGAMTAINTEVAIQGKDMFNTTVITAVSAVVPEALSATAARIAPEVRALACASVINCGAAAQTVTDIGEASGPLSRKLDDAAEIVDDLKNKALRKNESEINATMRNDKKELVKSKKNESSDHE